MAEERRPLSELLAKSGDGDFPRSVAEAVLQMLMEADVEGLIGAVRHERTGGRLPHATAPRPGAGHRAGSLQLRIPKHRQGSYRKSGGRVDPGYASVSEMAFVRSGDSEGAAVGFLAQVQPVVQAS